MRVLQLVQRPQRRGAELFADGLVREFRRRGIESRSIYLYGFRGAEALPVERPDLCLEGDSESWFERVPGVSPRLFRRLLDELREFRPDIVQANGGRTVKYGALAKRFDRAGRWLLVYRNIGLPSDWHHGWRTLWPYRAVLVPQIDAMVSVSGWSQEDATSVYRFNAPSRVIPNGCEPDRMRALALEDTGSLRPDPDRFTVLVLGALSPEKAPDRALRVVARAAGKDPRVRCWFVGDGPMRAGLEAEAARLGVGDRCTFHGFRSRVDEFLGAADVLLLTSESEGMPMVVLEAGYSGIPVIAPALGGLPECVDDGVTGLLISEAGDDPYVAAVLSLAEAPDLRTQMGMAARERIRDHFLMDKIAAEFAHFYEELLHPDLGRAV